MSRLRTNIITNRMANGAPTVSNGLVISGVTTTSDIKVGTGTTLNVYGGATYSGIVTATSFKGDGSQLTGVTQTTINSNADNRIITGSGTANTLNGESTLTYSGDTLLSTNSNFVIKSIDTNASNAENYIQFNAGYITYDSDATNSTGYSGHYFQADGAEKLRINGSGQLIFDADTNTYINRPAADKISITTGGSERFSVANTRIDAKEPLYLESAGSYIKSNQLLFNPSGAAYIDHGVTGQSINFRMSSSSALDTNAMTINHNGHITRPANPCASMTVDSNTISGNYMSHSSVHTNIGNHYNTGTSIFTCPVAGLYYVSIMVMSNNSNTTMDLEFHINGSNSNNILVPYSAATGGSYNQAVGSTIVYCPANAQLRFKLNSGSIYGGRHSNMTFALFA